MSSTPAASRPIGLARRGLAHACLGACMLLGCHRPPVDCEYDSVERCLWERGQTEPDSNKPKATTSEGNQGDGSLGEQETLERWTEFGSALRGLAELIGSGLEWSLVEEQARELCGTPPELLGQGSEDEDPHAWSCTLANALELDGTLLKLELGEGVVSLTADTLTERSSAQLVALARAAVDSCVDGFHAVDGPVNQEFERCTLRSGPLLFVGRFPRDLDADRWQVSIAVVDAG